MMVQARMLLLKLDYTLLCKQSHQLWYNKPSNIEGRGGASIKLSTANETCSD